METDPFIYLSGAHVPIEEPNLGRMVTFNGWWCDVEGYKFGIDNGCFNQPDKFSNDGYLEWLNQWPRTALFATAPDVVGEWDKTYWRSVEFLPKIRALGFKAALCAQDGIHPLDLEDIWDEFDCLFIGGTTEFKKSTVVRQICANARKQGKWVHMGRVNSWRRILLAVRYQCQSADGTFLRFGPNRHLNEIQSWARKLQIRRPLDA